MLFGQVVKWLRVDCFRMECKAILDRSGYHVAVGARRRIAETSVESGVAVPAAAKRPAV